MIIGLGLSAAVSAQGAIQSNDPLIQLAASMNGLALACKEQTPAQVDALYVQQRQAQLSTEVTAAQYDKAYALALDQFQKKWGSVDPATQQKQCSQVKAMSQQAAVAAKQVQPQSGKP